MAITALLVSFDAMLVRLGEHDDATTGRDSMLTAEEKAEASLPSTTTKRRSSSTDTAAERQSSLVDPFNFWSDRRALSVSFALANLLFASLYYIFQYDPQGTVEPSWTESYWGDKLCITVPVGSLTFFHMSYSERTRHRVHPLVMDSKCGGLELRDDILDEARSRRWVLNERNKDSNDIMTL